MDEPKKVDSFLSRILARFRQSELMQDRDYAINLVLCLVFVILALIARGWHFPWRW